MESRGRILTKMEGDAWWMGGLFAAYAGTVLAKRPFQLSGIGLSHIAKIALSCLGGGIGGVCLALPILYAHDAECQREWRAVAKAFADRFRQIGTSAQRSADETEQGQVVLQESAREFEAELTDFQRRVVQQEVSPEELRRVVETFADCERVAKESSARGEEIGAEVCEPAELQREGRRILIPWEGNRWFQVFLSNGDQLAAELAIPRLSVWGKGASLLQGAVIGGALAAGIGYLPPSVRGCLDGGLSSAFATSLLFTLPYKIQRRWYEDCALIEQEGSQALTAIGERVDNSMQAAQSEIRTRLEAAQALSSALRGAPSVTPLEQLTS